MSFDVETKIDAAGEPVEVITERERRGPYIDHLPSECLVTHCQIGDRSGFLCIGDVSVEKAKAALDRVAKLAGVERRAIVGDHRDTYFDRRKVQHLRSGFAGVWYGVPDGHGGHEFFQKFVTYDQPLSDPESDAIKAALGTQGVTDPERMLGGDSPLVRAPSLTIIDEMTEIPDEREFWEKLRRSRR